MAKEGSADFAKTNGVGSKSTCRRIEGRFKRNEIKYVIRANSAGAAPPA